MLLGRNKLDDWQWVSRVVFLVMFLVVYRRVCRRLYHQLFLWVYLVGYEVLGVNEPVTNHDKWWMSFALSKPVALRIRTASRIKALSLDTRQKLSNAECTAELWHR